ncbi:hypothetical protein [Dyadobacter sp. CY343]|uniref:hypothetical protein n=1 Tax=Dyadobacter sp. CY343 TaxID=2907299 RepID=UPI001F2C3F71|nr:hypothetical protein [Dyadobacter sp. CY343]MCE7061256.1 hypothetical protein [Dyadobacter sp. CY343]
MIGDVIKLEFQGEAAQLQKTLDDTNKKAKDLKQTITEIEKSGGKGSEEWKKYKNEMKEAQEQAAKLSKELKVMDVSKMTIRQLELAAKDLAKEMKNADRASADYVKNAKRLGEVEGELKKANATAKALRLEGENLAKPTLWSRITSGVKSVGTAFQAILALQIVQWLYNMGKAVFDTTAKFEKYEKVLATALGDPKLAKQSMEAIKKLASETAFSVDELTDGYVKMVNRGLRPSQAEMVKLTDLAASQGKTFDQLVEAVLDAQTGEFERLKEFGIKAKKEGDSVELMFKGKTVAVKNTEEAIYGAITALGAMPGVVGQNAEMMTTLTGKTSNLGDSFDSMLVTLGDGLKPVFIAILDLLGATIPVLGFVGKAIGSVLLVVKGLAVGIVDTFMNAGRAIFTLGEATRALTEGNFEGAKKLWDNAKTYGTAAMGSMKASVVQTGSEIKAMWSNPAAGAAAEFAGKEQGKKYQEGLTNEQKKEAAKRVKEKEKEMKSYADAEAKYDEQVKNDRAKVLELMAQMESEHNATVSKNTLGAEEAKINELRRKRIASVEAMKVDEQQKEAARVMINRNADDEISKAKDEFRAKELKAQQEADEKRIENTRFITETERQAELAVLDFRELAAKGNAKKLADIAKERLDLELRFLHEKLAQEEAAEKARINADITDKDQRAAAILAVENRYHQESITADKQAAEDKKQIDKDLHDKKAENVRAYSSMFASLLEGDINAFVAGAQKMVQGHKAAWQEKLAADTANYEAAGQAAIAAVNFLNDLAQKKAEKAIAEANRERDEKVAILTNELAVTDALITASSNYVTQLKSAETDRLTELQRILTSETTSEEEKRDALKRYYSEQLLQMKNAEEEKIKDLQRLANMAKTEDEKQAIEEKIRLAKNESEEKIRLAEEEAQSKMQTIDELSQFNTEITEAALAEATQASEKQILMASEEAEQKATFKEDLEETIAAENRKARATEMAEKKKAFAAQKKADIATALITGALAVLKALANFFPLNIILAATAAVVTGVQIAKIKNQPEPSFEQGGFIARGGKHGSSYGDGGIALVDRFSGREVGEMEGDEAIISAKQTEANWPIIQKMFSNARTPGLASTPVMKHPATPMAFKNGGMFESPYFERGMYLFGSKKRKAEQAAKDAEAEAAKAQAEADAAMGDMPSFDGSSFDGLDGGGSGVTGDTASAQAAHEEAQRQGKEQLKAIQDILTEAKQTNINLIRVSSAVGEVKQSVDGVAGAVRNVEGAVNASNTQGKFDALIGAISNLSAA